MPTNAPRSNPSREEQDEVRRKLEEIVYRLQPVREALEARGYRPVLEVNQDHDTVTLTMVVHTKWPNTTTPPPVPNEPTKISPTS